MSWQRIELADVIPSRWRNGGGETRELLAWPTADDWVWRMSVAEVAASGPFSRFEGVQRWFAVLQGAGVRLQVDESEHTLTSASAPFCFDGASATHCQLLAGATQDFNLMVRKQQATAQMRRVNADLRFLTSRSSVIAVYSIDGETRVRNEQESVSVPACSLVWQRLPAGVELELSASNALWMEIV
jgi:environmental stress-induced protein Ves